MIQVLHVYPVGADFETERGVEHLSGGLGGGFAAGAYRIGPGGDAPNVPAGVVGLRRRLGGADVVQAWGAGALTAAALAGGRRIVFCPPPELSRRQVGWLRAVMARRDVRVVCPAETVRRALVARGVPIERCHLIRPGFDHERLGAVGDRQGLRATLGVGPEQEVLLLPGESTRGADHRQGVWGATIVNILDRRTRVLTWGRGPLAGAVAAFAARLGQPEMLIRAEARLGRGVAYEALCAAADVLLVPATGAVATLPIATAMAAGLPAVGVETSTVAEVLEDGRTAVMTEPGVPRLLAKRILDLRKDDGVPRRLAEAGRAEAVERFSLPHFAEQWRAVYRQVAGGIAAAVEPASQERVLV
jgi:glycosyltransferase involved in cell wall biosynthesis